MTILMSVINENTAFKENIFLDDNKLYSIPNDIPTLKDLYKQINSLSEDWERAEL